jgi:hypothetical protein
MLDPEPFTRPVVVAYDGRLTLVDANARTLAWVRPGDGSFEASLLADALAKALNAYPSPHTSPDSAVEPSRTRAP